MKKLLLALALTLGVSTPSFGAIKIYFQDAKFPSQQMVERQAIDNPSATSTGQMLEAHAGNTGATAVTVSTFWQQPDVPRNVVITPGGTTNDVAACTITVNGTNFFGQAISEDFAFLANASSATTGNKAFKTVTSVVFPAACEDSPYGATWSVGIGSKLGLKNCLASDGDWLQSSVGGTYESTRATLATNATAVESNTATFNGTLNGSNDFVGYFFQNYRCNP